MKIKSYDCQAGDHDVCKELGSKLFYPVAKCQKADCKCKCHKRSRT